MFGRNEPRQRESGGELIQVHEVFYTIQGEGPFAGSPCVFIRLTGCNLKCWFCDTVWDDVGDPYATPKAVATKAAALAKGRTDLIVLTGGEPLRQDIGDLIEALNFAGFARVQIETAGTYWQDDLLRKGVTVVVSPKTKKVHRNFTLLNLSNVVWKYVIIAGQVDPEDGLPAEPFQRHGDDEVRRGGRPARPPEGATIYLQGCDEHDEELTAGNETSDGINVNGPATMRNIGAMTASCLQFGHIAGLQMHKYLGLD